MRKREEVRGSEEFRKGENESEDVRHEVRVVLFVVLNGSCGMPLDPLPGGVQSQ